MRTATEATAIFAKPPPGILSANLAIASGGLVKKPGEEMIGDQVELVAAGTPESEEFLADEELLGDATRSDPTRFAREDYGEEAWRILDPILGNVVPLELYDRGSWGPENAERGSSSMETGEIRLRNEHLLRLSA
jgi:glucose-6-phosphate 1-dehydrogenase